MKVGVLASGEGSNLQAILDRLHGGGGIEVVAVGSDKPTARALERAAAAGVPTRVFPLGETAPPGDAATPRVAAMPPAAPPYPDRATRDAAMADWLAGRGVELVVLAGYMQLVTPSFLARFPRGVINVHPALLPAFPGLRAIEQALEYGVKVTGVTVHFVDAGVDTGPVILQRALALEGTEDAAAVREALRPIEHELLCETVSRIAAGSVRRDPEHPRRVLVQ